MNETIANKVLELARSFHPEIREDSFVLNVFGIEIIDFLAQLNALVKKDYRVEIPDKVLLGFHDKGVTINRLITYVEGISSFP